jgi:hypothetical protein
MNYFLDSTIYINGHLKISPPAFSVPKSKHMLMAINNCQCRA